MKYTCWYAKHWSSNEQIDMQGTLQKLPKRQSTVQVASLLCKNSGNSDR